MSDIDDLTPREAWDLLASDERAVLVDVRTAGEWQQIGVPDTADLGREPVFVEWLSGTTHAVNPQFLDQLALAGVQPGDGRDLVFLCRSGVRSVAAGLAAQAAGFGPVHNVLQGFEGDVGPDGQRGHTGWRADGLPWRQA